jgi:hypothetical protein
MHKWAVQEWEAKQKSQEKVTVDVPEQLVLKKNKLFPKVEVKKTQNFLGYTPPTLKDDEDTSEAGLFAVQELQRADSTESIKVKKEYLIQVVNEVPQPPETHIPRPSHGVTSQSTLRQGSVPHSRFQTKTQELYHQSSQDLHEHELKGSFSASSERKQEEIVFETGPSENEIEVEEREEAPLEPHRHQAAFHTLSLAKRQTSISSLKMNYDIESLLPINIRVKKHKKLVTQIPGPPI